MISIPLHEAVQLVIDHRGKTPKKLGGDWTESGHRVVSALNIKNSRVDGNEHHYISTEMYEKWMPVPLRAGDVLVTSEAPLGEVAFLDRDVEWALGQRLFALRARPEILDGRYLYYLLKGGKPREELFARATGTTVLGIRQAELVRIQLELPSLAEQRAIAATLGALDDKIESNQRTISSMRKLMHAHFDKAPKYTTTASEVLTPVLGGTPRREVSTYWNGEIKWASAKDIAATEGGFVLQTTETVSELGIQNSAAKVMPAGTIVMTARGTVGALARLAEPMAFNQSCYGLRADKVSEDSLFIALEAAVARIREAGHGTVFNTINMSTFDQIKLELPISDNLDAILGALSNSILHRLNENLKLTALRDTLLPELLSGRISVPIVDEAS